MTAPLTPLFFLVPPQEPSRGGATLKYGHVFFSLFLLSLCVCVCFFHLSIALLAVKVVIRTTSIRLTAGQRRKEGRRRLVSPQRPFLVFSPLVLLLLRSTKNSVNSTSRTRERSYPTRHTHTLFLVGTYLSCLIVRNSFTCYFLLHTHETLIKRTTNIHVRDGSLTGSK